MKRRTPNTATNPAKVEPSTEVPAVRPAAVAEQPPTRPKPTTLELASIERDASINCRSGGVSERVAAEYAEAMKAGAKLPPVVVFRDPEGKHWLADGFHRCRAAELRGEAQVLAYVHEGDRRAALLHAAGANSNHGARRTRSDVRRAVLALLTDVEWREWSDREIASKCAVSPTTVGKLRGQLSKLDSSSRRGRDGKVRRVPKRKGAPRLVAGLKDARRGLHKVARSWPKGEPIAKLVELAREWLAQLERPATDQVAS